MYFQNRRIIDQRPHHVARDSYMCNDSAFEVMLRFCDTMQLAHLDGGNN